MEAARGAAVRLAYEGIARSLDHGRWRANDRILGERALATELGVSRASVRLALEALAAEGRVAPSPQRGWFVPRAVAGEPPSVLQSFSEMARARGAEATAVVIEHGVIAADQATALALRIDEGDEVVRLERVRGFDGDPIALEHVTIVLPLAAPLREVDFTDRSLYETLERETGTRIQRSSYTITAGAADARTAELLGLAPGDPVLIGDEVAFADTAGERVVLAGRISYRADAYRFTADLFRADH